MLRWKSLRMIAVAVAVTMSPTMATTAHAWNETGHRLVARIAWDELSPAQQDFATDLLSRHPRFVEDFEGQMPDAIKALPATDRERRAWVFIHAATWPDLVKDQAKLLGKQLAATGDGPEKVALERRLADLKRYDNPAWHYDNKPIQVDPYTLPAPVAPAASPRPVGIQLALPAALKELFDVTLPVEKRSLALAWVLHLLGDSHQPLHSAAIFSSRYLPQGDLGGNKLAVTTTPTAAPISLHQLWDDIFGDDPKTEKATKGRIVAAHPRGRLTREIGDVSPAVPLETTVNLWLDESFRAADTSVYDAHIRGVLVAAPTPDAAWPFPVALDGRYLQGARKVAMHRVALAGYRLADCIRRAESSVRP